MNTSISKEIAERDKVIVGSDGWLFLGNDSNNSTAQFVGEINLSPQSIEKLNAYLNAIKSKIECDFFFSISPNKEFVHPEKYPYVMREKSNGKALVHEQVISALDDCGIKYHYPAKELAEIPNSYYKTDTHWSEYGAYTTLSNFFLSSYNISLIELSSQNFSEEYVSGDLGSKLDGQKDGRLSYNFKVDEYEVFNSNLKNHGYGVHYVNPNAPNQRKVLVFGDSFGISYIKPLALTFREVVFLYSPATFIENVYEYFSPDIVIFQINQRFLLDPPNYRYNLENSLVFKKFKPFNENEINDYVYSKKNTEKKSFLSNLYLDGLSTIAARKKPIVSSSFPGKKVIFNGEHIEVHVNIMSTESKKIVATFTARSDKPQKSGFGEAFFEKNSIPAIHFISKSNHWWQIPEMKTAIEKATPFLDNFSEIFTYGASMGGHGALIFSKALKANHIIVGSPQFAIKGRLTPWTPRWERDTKDVNETFPIEEGLAKTAEIYCIYDPFNHFDRLHVNQINTLAPIKRIKTSFSGHSAVLQLKNLGVLSTLLKSIIYTPEKIDETLMELKRKRSTNLNYLIGLGARSLTHTYRKAISIWANAKAFSIAKEIAFGNTSEDLSHADISIVFKSYCNNLIKLNRTDEAVNFSKKYCERYPDTYLSYELLSNTYWKAKDYSNALLEAKRALRLNRQNPSLRLSVTRLHLALNQIDDAMHHLDIALGFPSKDKKAWIALYKDMDKYGCHLETKEKIIMKIKEIDPHYENSI